MVELKKDIYWIGVKDPKLEVFDVIMETKKGTTYNSYLINDEKVAIVDTVKDKFFDEYIKNIKEIIKEKPVDYIIVQHTELDHSGSLKMLLKEYPKATIVASKAAVIYLKDILNEEFKSLSIDEVLNLGENNLQFIKAPNLHWPDTIFAYIKGKNIIFTCDFLGAHFCPNGNILNDKNEEFSDEIKYYFDVIMGPFKKFVLMALDKIKEYEFDMICTSHGPVILGGNIEKYLNLYEEWSKNYKNDENVEILYVSAYGNTKEVAQFICDELNKNGILSNCSDITSIGIEKSAQLITNSKAFILGSPTINQDAVKPIWDVLSLVCPINNNKKPATAFGSFGWSGEAVGLITNRLKGLKLKVLEQGFKFKFVPSSDDYKKAEEFAKEFIKFIN